MHQVRNCGPQNACTPEMLFDYLRTSGVPGVPTLAVPSQNPGGNRSRRNMLNWLGLTLQLLPKA